MQLCNYLHRKLSKLIYWWDRMIFPDCGNWKKKLITEKGQIWDKLKSECIFFTYQRRIRSEQVVSLHFFHLLMKWKMYQFQLVSKYIWCMWYISENQQFFHCETAWCPRVQSFSYPAHHEVSCLGGAHHSEHRRWKTWLIRGTYFNHFWLLPSFIRRAH